MNPWRTLDLHTKKDLIDPLFDRARFDQGDRADYDAWSRQYYQEAGAPSGQPPAHLERYAEWRFNHRFSHEERNSLLCVYAKLKHEGLWHLVRSINWAGTHGELDFWPTLPQEWLRDYLRAHDFSEACLADMGKGKWGLRSNKVGVELHFRGRIDGTGPVNAHIDLHNPGNICEPGQAIEHKISDDWRRTKTHTVRDIRAGLIWQGVRNIQQVP